MVRNNDTWDYTNATAQHNMTDHHGNTEFGSYANSTTQWQRMPLIGYNNTMEIPIYGFVTPIIVFFTIITNTLVCIVLVKRHMRSATNMLLLAMALSDLLTGIWPVPLFIYFYAYENYKDYVTYDVCFIYNIFTDYLPTIFHTASIWLTLCLAAQRYLYVCHSIRAKSWCTIKNMLRLVWIVYIASFLAHTCRFFEREYSYKEVYSLIQENVTINACKWRFTPIVDKYADVYFNVYYWFRVFCIHLIPCLALVFLNACLVHTMRRAQHRRRLLLKQHRNSESRRIKESNGTTLMLVLVVGVFLLVELPSGVLFILHIMTNSFSLEISDHDLMVTSLILNLFILLSYPINFFIYCGMSRQFRDTFKGLFIPGTAPLPVEQTQYMTLTMESQNGTKINTSVM